MTTRTIQPGERGADYISLSNKTADLFHRYGVTNVTRYIKPGMSSYEITAKERDFLFWCGIAITLVFETGITAINGGAAQGKIDGLRAAVDAAAIGYPHECPIFAAVDTDVVKSNSAQCEAYLRAFYTASAPWVDGLYGDTEAYKLVADRHPIWCKPNAGGWDADQAARSLAHILQGHEEKQQGWDYPNVCVHPFTAWSGLGADEPATVHPPTDTTKPAPQPAPIIHLEDDMANVGVITLPDAKAQFIGYYVGPISGPRFLHLDWINSDAMIELADGHIGAGATVFGDDQAKGWRTTSGAAHLVKANLKNCIVDTLPHGDELTTWTSPTDIIVRS